MCRRKCSDEAPGSEQFLAGACGPRPRPPGDDLSSVASRLHPPTGWTAQLGWLLEGTDQLVRKSLGRSSWLSTPPVDIGVTASVVMALCSESVVSGSDGL
jgi:hypothetical protein